jgi:hypothetical protein
MGFKAVAKHAPVYVTAKIFAAEDTSQIIFTADRSYEVVGIMETHSAGDAAGTVQVQKVPSGTAIGSGVDLVTTVFDLNSTADTPVIKDVQDGGLTTTEADRKLVRGDSLALEFGGTLNDTYQGVFTIVLKPIPGSGDLA